MRRSFRSASRCLVPFATERVGLPDRICYRRREVSMSHAISRESRRELIEAVEIGIGLEVVPRSVGFAMSSSR